MHSFVFDSGGFATFVDFGKPGYPPTCGLKHAAACCSTAIFTWGPLVLDGACCCLVTGAPHEPCLEKKAVSTSASPLTVSLRRVDPNVFLQPPQAPTWGMLRC